MYVLNTNDSPTMTVNMKCGKQNIQEKKSILKLAQAVRAIPFKYIGEGKSQNIRKRLDTILIWVNA